MDLLECRKQLDEIDSKLVELFEKRMQICSDVADFKIATGKEVYDGVREQQKLDSVSALAHGEYNQTAIREVFLQMMTISRRYQYSKLAEHGKTVKIDAEYVPELKLQDVKVAYQGVAGAYAHAATLQFFGENADAFHCESFDSVMKAVSEGQADYGVLPIENSSAGAVIDNFDLLVKYQNYIVAEIFLPVSHALLAGPDTEMEDIKTVYSHPQALMQCSEYLNSKKWQQISLANTAVAAKKILEDGDKTHAAVASEIAGKLYGLKTIQTSIQNNKGNTTRFIIISRKPQYCEDAGKISLCFELPHRYGTLYNILGHLVFNHLNMMMIFSRPVPGRNWEYRFFVDIEGNLRDLEVQNALKSIEAEASGLRILGNY